MSEKSRDEKLAAAKKKLKKFQDSNTKEKNKQNKSSDYIISNNQLRLFYFLHHNPYGLIPFLHFMRDLPNNSNVIDLERNELQPNNTSLSRPINVKDNNGSPLDIEEPTVTTESLKHISRHLNGILSCSSSSIDRENQIEYTNTIRDLEKRNIELASLNSQKAEHIETLQVRITNLNEALERSNKDRIEELLNLETSYKKQLDCNKDQFQAQIHTISLLVAEKSELHSQVTHNQKVAAQRHQENEDITNKLKTSRQKVGDLEKGMNELKIKNDKLEEAYRDISRQTEQMRNTIKRLKSEKEDTTAECSQLKSKLLSKTQEVSNLELTLDDIKSHLEMSQVQIQHLTNTQEGQYDNMHSKLKMTEKKNADLLQNLESMKLQLQQADSQSTRVQNQYRNYFEQMEDKLKILQTQLAYTVDERNSLSVQLDTYQKNISHEKNDKDVDLSDLKITITNLQEERKKFIDKEEEFEILIKDLNKKNKSLLNDNEQLAKVNEELEEKNTDLKEKNNQFEVNKVDHVDLLKQLQSDKTALSRALAQNKQLKSQLIELQEAFVNLSSDNMDLSTQLDHEKHVSKELSIHLGEQEDDLNEIRIIVGNKDKEIAKLIQSNSQITEELLTSNNNSELNNSKRSESHFNMANKELVTNLQIEVSHLQARINQLTTENNALQYKMNHYTDEKPSHNQNDISMDNDNFLNINILQLESERDELLMKCEAYNIKETDMLKYIDNCKEAIDENGLVVTEEKYQALQRSMLEINEKYNNILMINAKIMEDNKQLEHIVAQLEGETDTIGEYISLYQHQRSILKQRSLAKDQFMSKLLHKKLLLDSKLSALEHLIRSIDFQEKTDKPPCNDDVREAVFNNKTNASVFNQIFDIISELQKPADYMVQTAERSSIEDIDMKPKSDNDFFTSDNLFHSEFIHCKCCVGKVIDL